MKSHGRVTAEHLRALGRVYDGLTRSLSEDEAYDALDEGPMPPDEYGDAFDEWASNHELAQP